MAMTLAAIQPAGRAEQMAGHGFCRASWAQVWRVLKNRLDRECFNFII